MHSTKRSSSLFKSIPPKVVVENASFKNEAEIKTKYSLHVNPKKLAFLKLRAEIKYANSGKEFTAKLLRTFDNEYHGEDKDSLAHIVASLSTDTNRSRLFHLHQQFTPEFQQALAIGYIKDKSAEAFQDGKFNFMDFMTWCKDCEIHNNFTEHLAKINFQNISYKNNTVTFHSEENNTIFQLKDLHLTEPNLDPYQLIKLANYQLATTIEHPLVNNLTLARIARQPNLTAHLKEKVKKEMRTRLETALAKTDYHDFMKQRILECFIEEQSNLDLDISNLWNYELPNWLYKNKFDFDTYDMNNLKLKQMISNEILLLLPNMKSLCLPNHDIGEVNDELNNLEKLEVVNLSENKLANIKIKLPPNVITFNIRKNNLRTALIEGINLKVLNLNHNNLSANTLNVNAHNLEDFNLSYNQINEMPEVSDMPKLISLDLEENKITEINAECLEKLNKLQFLRLNDNQITNIKNAFKNPFLNSVSLSNNKLTQLLPDTFQGYLTVRVDFGYKNLQFLSKDVIINSQPIFRQIYQDTNDLRWIKITANNIGIDNPTVKTIVCQQYLQDQIPKPIYETYCLELLLRNDLQNKQVKNKLIHRLSNGELKIDLKHTQKDFDFFIQLTKDTGYSSFDLTFNNLNYFLQSENGKSNLLHRFANELLIVPTNNDHVDYLTEIEVLAMLRVQNNNTLLNKHQYAIFSTILNQLKQDSVSIKLNEMIADEIRHEISDAKKYSSEMRKIISEHIPQFVYTLRLKTSTEIIKSSALLTVITNYLPPEFTIKQRDTFIQFLLNIKIDALQKKYVTQNLLTPILGEDIAAESYPHFIPFINWSDAVAKCQATELNKTSLQAIKNDKNFMELIANTTDNRMDLRKLYNSYILNTLPYRTAENIYNLLEDKSNNLFSETRAKLNLVMRYFAETIFTIDNYTDYTQIGNYINDKAVKQATQIFVLENSHNKKDYRLLYLHDLAYLNPANKGFILAKHMLLLNRNFIEEQLTFINFKKYVFPLFLKDLITPNFTVANTVASQIDHFMQNVIANSKISLDKEELQKMTETYYLVATKTYAPSVNHLSVKWRQKLVNIFDYDGYFSRIHHQLQEIITSQVPVELIPQKLLEAVVQIKNLPRLEDFLNKSTIKIKELLHDLNVQRYEVAYILGAIFMSLSSTYAFGYHIPKDIPLGIKEENYSLMYFRVLGAILLAHACGDILDKKVIIAIGEQIKQAISKDICAMIIVNSLVGNTAVTDLNKIKVRANTIITA